MAVKVKWTGNAADLPHQQETNKKPTVRYVGTGEGGVTYQPSVTVKTKNSENTDLGGSTKKGDRVIGSPGGTFLGGFSYKGKSRREKTAQEQEAEKQAQMEAYEEYVRLATLDLDAQEKAIAEAKEKAARSKPKYNIHAFGAYDTTPTDEEKNYSKLLADLNKAKSIQYDIKGRKELDALTAEQTDALGRLSKASGTQTAVMATNQAREAAAAKAEGELMASGLSDEKIRELLGYYKNIPKREKNAELYEEMQQAGEAYAETNPGLATVTSVGTNLVSGIGAIKTALDKAIDPDAPIDYHGGAFLPYAYTSGVRNTVSKNLETDYGKGASFAYGVGTSMLDSAATVGMTMAGVPAWLATSTLGGAAATAAMQEAKDRGLDDNRAIWTGLLAGAAETAFEKISLESLISMKAPTGTMRERILGTIKNTAKQAGIEGSEEVFTDFANLIADGIVNGDLSQVQQTISRYIDDGMTEQEARNKAVGEWLKDTAVDFAAGALAGGIMGGGANALSRASQKAEIKREYTGREQELIDKSKELLPDNQEAEKLRSKMQSKLGSKRGLTGGDIEKLLQSNADAPFVSDVDKITAAVKNQLELYGESGNTDLIASAVTKRLLRENESGKETDAFVNSKYGQRVLNELNPENFDGENRTADDKPRALFNSEWAGKIGTKVFAPEVFSRDVGVTGAKYNAETGKLDAIVKDDVGKIQTVPAEKAELSPLQEELFDWAADLGEAGPVLVSAYRQTQNLETYARQFHNAYEYGKAGVPMDYVNKSQAVSDLNTTQREIAYEEGAKAHQRELQGRQEKKRSGGTVDSTTKKKPTVSLRGATVGGVKYAAVNKKAMDGRQWASVGTMKAFAQATGVNVVFYESQANERGEYEGANGFYKDGTLYLDINAGRDRVAMGETAILKTAAHEITHYIKEGSPEQYEVLKNFVVSKLTREKGLSFDDLVTDKQRREPGLSYEEAVDEVVADACEMMLKDSKAVEQLARENRSLAERIRQWIRKWVRSLKAAMEGLTADRPESRAMMQYAQELQEIWDNALVDAARNGRGTMRENAPAEVKQQARVGTSESIKPDEKSLKGKRDDGKMDAVKDLLKEDLDSGEERKEDRGAFLRRATGEGLRIFEGDSIAYGYRTVPWGSAGENARQVQKELTALGIDAEITEGYVHWNLNGISSRRAISQAVTIEKRKVLISNRVSLPSKNAAGHEAFHFWGSTQAREAYADELSENLNFSSKEFVEYQAVIAEAYLGGEADLSDSTQLQKLREELFAYISGDIHEGVNDDLLRPMFRDYDAVKAAWVKLCKDRDGGKVQNQQREPRLSDRAVLEWAAEMALRDQNKSWTAEDRRQLEMFKSRLRQLEYAQAALAALKEERAELLAGRKVSEIKGEERTELTQNRNRMDLAKKNVKKWEDSLWKLESQAAIKKLLRKSRITVEQETAFKARQRYREKVEDRQRYQVLKKRLERTTSEWKRMLLKPTKDRYAPEELVRSCLEVAMMLDESGPREGTKSKYRYETTSDALAYMKKQYDALADSEDQFYRLGYDKELSGLVEKLREALAGKAIRDLTYEEAGDVAAVLVSMQGILKEARYQIGSLERISTQELVDGAVRQMLSAPERSKTEAATDAVARQSASVMRNIRRMVQYDENAALYKLFHQLEEGVKKKDRFIMEANKLFDRFAGERMLKSATELKTYHISGVDMNMTEMEVMQLILSAKRELSDKTRHLEGKGFIVPDLELMRKGKGQDAISKGQELNKTFLKDILKLEDGLDAWAKDYMHTASEFFNGMARNAINEATVQTKHRRMAVTKDYVPYEVDKRTVVKDIDGVKFDATIEGDGMLKSVVAGAQNPLIIRGLNTIVENHIERVGRIYGLAVPIRNFNKAYNAKSQKGQGMSMKEAITRAWPAADTKLIEQAITDLQTSRERATDDISKLMRKTEGKFVEATLLSNISVTIKQAASYSTAGLYLSQKALFPYQATIAKLFAADNSAFAKKLFAEIDEHTPMHYMRRKGMSMEEAATIAQDNSKVVRWMDKKLPDVANPLKWIQNMDVATTAAIWLATKRQVELDGVKQSDPTYWSRVTELYEKVISETQPMYDSLHRPEVQKNTNEVLRGLMMFRTQPLQNAGILYDAAGELAQAKKNGDQEQIKAAGRKFKMAVGSQVASLAVFATMTLLAYAVRNRLGRYRDDEEELTVVSIMKRVLGDMAVNGAQLIAPIGGGLIAGGIEKVITGSSYGGTLSIPTLDAINDWLSQMDRVRQDIVKLSEDEEADIVTDSVDFAMDTAGVLGIPAKNAFGILRGIVGNITDLTGHELSWATDKPDPSMAIVKACFENGHMEKGREVIDQVIQSKMDAGKEEKEARSAVRSSLTAYYKKLYLRAYKKKNEKEMKRIRMVIQGSRMYDDNAADVAAGWVKKWAEEEKKKKNKK